MLLTRRLFVAGLLAAPAVVRAPSLMPVRALPPELLTPREIAVQCDYERAWRVVAMNLHCDELSGARTELELVESWYEAPHEIVRPLSFFETVSVRPQARFERSYQDGLVDGGFFVKEPTRAKVRATEFANVRLGDLVSLPPITANGVTFRF